MSSRRWRTPVIAVVGAMTLLLSGCGSLHPGQAAKVGDTVITNDQLNDTASGLCELIKVTQSAQARGGESPPVGMRIATLNAISQLMLGVAVDRLAKQQGVSVSPAQVQQWVEQLPLQSGQFGGETARDVQSTAHRIGRTNLLITELGKIRYRQQNPGQPPPQDPSQYQQLGQQWLLNYLRKLDTQTDPRFGDVLTAQQQDPGTGSLSVAVSDKAKQSRTLPQPGAGLPAEQNCP